MSDSYSTARAVFDSLNVALAEGDWHAVAEREFRVVALRAKEKLILAQARAVERPLRDYSLNCGHSMGMSYDDSDGPLAEEARSLGAIACFTLGPPSRIISGWILEK
jgi:hypothetical protein